MGNEAMPETAPNPPFDKLMANDSRPQSARPNPPSRLPAPSRDPLYALQTPQGEGAIATFVLDGEETFALAQKIIRTSVSWVPFEKGTLLLGRLVDAGGKLVDEVVLAPIDVRESPSAMERVEVSCHGGIGVVDAVIQTLKEAGFRPAWSGELEARAHRAARLSLPSIEAQFRMTRNLTARQVEFLLGYTLLQERWERFGMNAALGARQRQTAWRDELTADVGRALNQADAGLRLARTHRVVVAGPVNAGKSTLVNALLGSEQSLVSDAPGTTRDHLVRPAHLRGLNILLSDTAGLRSLDDSAQSDIEREGQVRARNAAAEADLVLYLIDGSRAPTDAECDEVERFVKSLKAAGRGGVLILVQNKSDLALQEEASGLGFALGIPSHAVSAMTGQGLDGLESVLERELLQGTGPEPGAAFTRRQRLHLEALRAGLEESLDAVELIGHIRALVGTRPDEEELATVFREAVDG